MKDLGSSAKRYSRNIRMAKMAMLDMDEERSGFAKMLGQIMRHSCLCLDARSLSGVETGLNSIANATADVGLSTRQADYARAATSEANMAKAGEVAASAVSLASTVAVAGAAIVGGAALTMGAVTTGALCWRCDPGRGHRRRRT